MNNFGKVHSITPKTKAYQHTEGIEKSEEIPEKENKILIYWCKNRNQSGPDVEVIMDLSVSVPMILPINNWFIETQHNDQVPQCQNCYKIGHFTNWCLNKKVQFKTYSSFANKRWGT